MVEYDGRDTMPVLGLIASSFMLLGALSSHVENPATLMARRLGRPTESERTRERVPLMGAAHTGGLSWTLVPGQAPR